MVLSPAQDIFSKPITITPTESIPGGFPYALRGIWNVRVVDVMLMDGAQLTSRTIETDIRVLELPLMAASDGTFGPVIPMQGDGVAIFADDQFVPLGYGLGDTVNLLVDDVRADSGGAVKLILKRVI